VTRFTPSAHLYGFARCLRLRDVVDAATVPLFPGALIIVAAPANRHDEVHGLGM